MNCYKHSETSANGLCTNCGNFICADCLLKIDGKIICKDCFSKGHNTLNTNNVNTTKENVGGISGNSTTTQKPNAMDEVTAKIKNIDSDKIADDISNVMNNVSETAKDITHSVKESKTYQDNKEYLPIILSFILALPFLIGTFKRLFNIVTSIFNVYIIGIIISLVCLVISLLSIAVILIAGFMIYKRKKLKLPTNGVILLPICVGILSFISRAFVNIDLIPYYGIFRTISYSLPFGTIISILMIIGSAVLLGLEIDKLNKTA